MSAHRLGLAIALLGAVCGGTLRAQSVAASCEPVNERSPRFDVATIKQVEPGSSGTVGSVVYPGGRIRLRRFPFKTLVHAAFGIDYGQIAGAEPWMDNTLYDVEAKPPAEDRPGSFDLRYTTWEIEDLRLRKMLRALLVDRFQLKFHCEQRPGKVYLLKTARKPLRLRPTKLHPAPDDAAEQTGRSGDIGFAGGEWVLFNASAAQIARYAAAYVVHAPVLDQTDLTGSFDYRQTDPLNDDEANYRDPSDSFLRLMGELGLQLKPARGVVDTLVIDHAEKPAPN